MSEHYPNVRVLAQSGYLVLREGLSLTFYMRHSHAQVKQGVLRSLEAYLGAVGRDVLSFCTRTTKGTGRNSMARAGNTSDTGFWVSALPAFT